MKPPRGLLALLVVPAVACGVRGLSATDNRDLYEQAREQIQRGQYVKARKTLGLVGLAEPVSPELDPLVKLATADAFFLQGGGLNVIEAQSRYQQFLNFYPTHQRGPYGQYQLGECLVLQSEGPANDQEFTLRAIEAYRKVPDLDPRSAYARAAEGRIREAEDKLAEKEWLVARFYARGRRWTAVVGRLGALLDRFPGYGRRADAFLLLGRALLETGKTAEARIYLEKLVADDPDGEVGVAARELLAQQESGG